tara:strand:+ start:8404 stop:8523 length:120 start_codon:yes stop_codon:yes gene_type:complete
MEENKSQPLEDENKLQYAAVLIVFLILVALFYALTSYFK